jgi:hypothetical protein
VLWKALRIIMGETLRFIEFTEQSEFFDTFVPL